MSKDTVTATATPTDTTIDTSTVTDTTTSPLRWLDEHPRTFLAIRLIGTIFGGFLLTVIVVAAAAIAGAMIGMLLASPIIAASVPDIFITGELLAKIALPFTILGALFGLWYSYRLLVRRHIRASADPRPRSQIARQIVLQAIVAHRLGCLVSELRLGLAGGGELTKGIYGACAPGSADARSQDITRIDLQLAVVALVDENGKLCLSGEGGKLAAHDANLDKVVRLAQRIIAHCALANDQSTPMTTHSVIAEARHVVEDLTSDIWHDHLRIIEAELVRGGLMRGERFRQLLANPPR